MTIPHIRLLIVDDHAIIHYGLKTLLFGASSIESVASASDGAEALELCKSFAPNIILLDLRMPRINGHNTLEILTREYPQIRVLIHSGNDTPAEIKLAKQNGAAGFVSKSADPSHLLDAIQKIAAGGSHFPDAHRQRTDLTTRELEVLHYLVRGLSNDEIGKSLGISAEAIKGHLKRMFPKLAVSTRTEAVSRALELGLL
jgi:DNA-binding NarL/FixJ family response regulator